MTLEELADLSADKLEALSNEELSKILTPFFVVTRPELAPKRQPKQQEMVQLSPEKMKALAMLADEGVDISFLKRKKK